MGGCGGTLEIVRQIARMVHEWHADKVRWWLLVLLGKDMASAWHCAPMYQQMCYGGEDRRHQFNFQP